MGKSLVGPFANYYRSLDNNMTLPKISNVIPLPTKKCVFQFSNNEKAPNPNRTLTLECRIIEGQTRGDAATKVFENLASLIVIGGD